MFWDVTLCEVVNGYQPFKRILPPLKCWLLFIKRCIAHDLVKQNLQIPVYFKRTKNKFNKLQRTPLLILHIATSRGATVAALELWRMFAIISNYTTSTSGENMAATWLISPRKQTSLPKRFHFLSLRPQNHQPRPDLQVLLAHLPLCEPRSCVH